MQPLNEFELMVSSLLFQPFLFVGRRYEFSGLKTEIANFSGEEKVIFVCSAKSSVRQISAREASQDRQRQTGRSSVDESAGIVTYEGILTARVSETAFQLDNEPQLKLMMTHWPCSSGGRGKVVVEP